MTPEYDDHCLLGFVENGRTRLLRPGPQVLHRRPLETLSGDFGIDAQFRDQMRERSLRLQYSTLMAWALVTNLPHTAPSIRAKQPLN